MLHQEEDLRQYQRERDEALVKEKVLDNKVQELELEAESRSNVKEDKARHVKIMEVLNGELNIDSFTRLHCESHVAARGLQERINQLEMNLDEERQNGDQLMDRIDRGREQVEHTRVSLSACVTHLFFLCL